MAIRWRQHLVFGLGLLLGVAAGGGMLVAAEQWRAREAADSAAPAAATTVALPQASACEEAPMLANAGPSDGQFGPPPEAVDKTRYDVTAFIAVGEEAAQQGRVRDAEVAFITACRIAAHLAQDDPPALGDAAYRLGRHYLAVTAADPAGHARELQLGRAEAMFQLGMQAYSVRLGPAHEKTRLAAAGMTLARQAAALTGPLQAAALAQPPASSPVAIALAGAGAVHPPTATLGGPSQPVKPKPRARRPAADAPVPEEDIAAAPPAPRAVARRETPPVQREESPSAEAPAPASLRAAPAPLPYGPELESP